MSATKHRLGRDPELHEIHETAVEANRYIGKPGEITFTRAVPGGSLVDLRCHDGLTPGGYAAQLEVAASVPGMLANAKAVPPIAATLAAGVDYAVHHQLGYMPMVQVLDAANAVITAIAVTHHDTENLSINTPVAGDYLIILR